MLNDPRPNGPTLDDPTWRIRLCRRCNRRYLFNRSTECSQCGWLVEDDLPEEPPIVVPRLTGAAVVLVLLLAIWWLLGG